MLRSPGTSATVRSILVILAVMLHCPLWAAAQVEIVYAFDRPDHSGLVHMTAGLDHEGAPAVNQRTIWTSDKPVETYKLAVTADRRWVAVGLADRQPRLLVTRFDATADGNADKSDPSEAPAAIVREIDLPDDMESIITAGRYFLVADGGGGLSLIDPEAGRLVRRWVSRTDLDPPGHKIEEMTLSPCRGFVLCTFQKDSRNGRRFGSRLVILRLPSLERVHDLRLPRDRPELHNPNNLAEQGPNPELVMVCPRSNRLILSLDLYGAMAFADLDVVMRDGRLENYTVISSDIQGRWGDAFPDRGRLFDRDGQTLLWVANSGKAGGVVVMNVATRQVMGRFATRPGLEAAIALPDSSLLVAAGRGKIKTREDDQVARNFEAIGHVYIFDLDKLSDERVLDPRRIEVNEAAFFAVGGIDADHAVILVGEDTPDRFKILNVQTGNFSDPWPAVGPVGRWQAIAPVPPKQP